MFCLMTLLVSPTCSGRCYSWKFVSPRAANCLATSYLHFTFEGAFSKKLTQAQNAGTDDEDDMENYKCTHELKEHLVQRCQPVIFHQAADVFIHAGWFPQGAGGLGSRWPANRNYGIAVPTAAKITQVTSPTIFLDRKTRSPTLISVSEPGPSFKSNAGPARRRPPSAGQWPLFSCIGNCILCP